jgi:hypothetical protein
MENAGPPIITNKERINETNFYKSCEAESRFPQASSRKISKI